MIIFGSLAIEFGLLEIGLGSSTMKLGLGTSATKLDLEEFSYGGRP